MSLFQTNLPEDDNGEVELTQWFKVNVTSIRQYKAKKYITALVGVGIDSVKRLLRAADDSNDKRIKSIMIEDDLNDLKSAIAGMTKKTDNLSNPNTVSRSHYIVFHYFPTSVGSAIFRD